MCILQIIKFIGLFFFMIQYAAQAGWSAFVVRVPLAMAHWIAPAFLLVLGGISYSAMIYSTGLIVIYIQ